MEASLACYTAKKVHLCHRCMITPSRREWEGREANMPWGCSMGGDCRRGLKAVEQSGGLKGATKKNVTILLVTAGSFIYTRQHPLVQERDTLCIGAVCKGRRQQGAKGTGLKLNANGYR